ncbi:MAG: hypothetical protein V1816_25665 [Pseudomonadota bacterium]
MAKILTFPEEKCRHEILGRCSNHFWNVMKECGKPGLDDYQCVLWRDKLRQVEDYREATRRAHSLGLTGEAMETVAAKLLGRLDRPAACCPHYRPKAQAGSSLCRYFFLETCLLTFPFCRGRCDDFLPLGDQKG